MAGSLPATGNFPPNARHAPSVLANRIRPDVMAICHGHPPTATGFAVAGRSALNHALLPEVVVGLGQIPLVQYATYQELRS